MKKRKKTCLVYILSVPQMETGSVYKGCHALQAVQAGKELPRHQSHHLPDLNACGCLVVSMLSLQQILCCHADSFNWSIWNLLKDWSHKPGQNLADDSMLNVSVWWVKWLEAEATSTWTIVFSSGVRHGLWMTLCTLLTCPHPAATARLASPPKAPSSAVWSAWSTCWPQRNSVDPPVKGLAKSKWAVQGNSNVLCALHVPVFMRKMLFACVLFTHLWGSTNTSNIQC